MICYENDCTTHLSKKKKNTSQKHKKTTEKKKTEKETNKTDKNYIILMKIKNHLQFRTDSMTTCINKKLRKASQIRKIKEKTSSRTVIKCIKNINKSINTN